ncbi:MAG: hypothetical protein H0V75_11815 [Rubrobacter sp.]|nr:hypothetical protein [Rubrobacter sp.]
MPRTESGRYERSPCSPGITHPDSVSGGKQGNDSIYGSSGADRISGGSGGDALYGGGGSDVLVGNGGQYFISGDDGNDRIIADEGNRGWIPCGPGFDTVRADPDDVVDRTCGTETIYPASPFLCPSPHDDAVCEEEEHRADNGRHHAPEVELRVLRGSGELLVKEASDEGSGDAEEYRHDAPAGVAARHE